MSIPDKLIIKYYELATDIHPDMIDRIIHNLNAGINPRDIKMELAKEIVKLYCGEELSMASEARRLIQQGAVKLNGVKIEVLDKVRVEDGAVLQVGKLKYGKIVII